MAGSRGMSTPRCGVGRRAMFEWLRRGNGSGRPVGSERLRPAAPYAHRAGLEGDQEAPMIDLRGISKVYHTDAGPFPALKGIDLQVYPGEFVAVVGKSGSGKSTLINMFTGID
ncbi:MAG: ATP-binding cassette domain-containing protein, partial [Anaerolineae bacterium]